MVDANRHVFRPVNDIPVRNCSRTSLTSFRTNYVFYVRVFASRALGIDTHWFKGIHYRSIPWKIISWALYKILPWQPTCASTNVSSETIFNIVRRQVVVFANQCVHVHNHSWRAITALGAIEFRQVLLDFMVTRFRTADIFYRSDAPSLAGVNRD